MKTDSFFLVGEEAAEEAYHYRTCGLEGIYLLNGYSVECHDGEEHVTIKDVDGLHSAIGRHLVLYRKALAPREIRFLRNTMDLTQGQLAKRLGNNSQSVARWEKGICAMDGLAEKLLRAIFLASVITDKDDLQALQDLLTTVLDELDEMDELQAAPAQFRLFETWSEERVAA